MCQVDLTHLTWNWECSKVGDLILSVGESLSSFPSLKFDICFTSLEDHGAWRTMKLYPGSSYTWVWCDSCVGWSFYLFLGFICRTGFFCRWVRCLTVLRPKEDPTNHPKSVHRHLSLHPTAGLLGSLPSWTPFTVSKCVGRRAIRRPICPASFSDARHPKKIRYWRIVGFINFG